MLPFQGESPFALSQQRGGGRPANGRIALPGAATQPDWYQVSGDGRGEGGRDTGMHERAGAWGTHGGLSSTWPGMDYGWPSQAGGLEAGGGRDTRNEDHGMYARMGGGGRALEQMGERHVQAEQPFQHEHAMRSFHPMRMEDLLEPNRNSHPSGAFFSCQNAPPPFTRPPLSTAATPSMCFSEG